MNKLPNIALSLMASFFGLEVLAETAASGGAAPRAQAAEGAAAQNKPVDFMLELGAGTEYDSTLSVVELDRTSDEGDWAAAFNGELGAELHPTDRVTLKGSYSFSSRNYREYDEFDQDLHIVALDGSIDLAGVRLGMSQHFAHARLASEPLLDLSKTSLYAGKLFNGKTYLRGAMSESNKRFEDNSGRNADTDELTADLFYFFNGARSYWSVGVSREAEQARSPAFDNSALKLRARYSHTAEIAGRESQVQLGWRYQNRDYSKRDSLLARDTRHDRSHVVEASWALGLVEWLTLETKIEYGDHSSNLEAADYKETGVSTMLSAEF